MDSNVTLNLTISALQDGYFIVLTIAILFIWAIWDLKRLFNAFHKKEPLVRLSITTFALFVLIGVLFYIQSHKINKVPVNSDQEDLNEKIQCTHGDDDCEFSNSFLECGGYKDNNSSIYNCTYENRIHSTFAWPDPSSETLKLENVIYEIDDLKINTNESNLKATFNLHSPVNNQMIDLPDKPINISICGMKREATPNPDSTYSITVDWKTFETMARKNCKESICIDQNDKGCYAKNIFDIVLPLGKKHVYMKDNVYVFHGNERQNDISIPIRKTNFEIKGTIRLLTPATCFTLVAGDDIVKIENNVVSINKDPVGIANLTPNEPISLMIQKNSRGFMMHISQIDGIGGPIVLPHSDTIKDHINIGFTIAKKTKKKVMEFGVDEINDIR